MAEAVTGSDQTEEQKAQQREKIRQEIRDDFMRRLFAVAISVGAAATLVEMDWVTDGRMPCFDEWQQLAILIAAMTATVLSWDGYLYAIHERPLRDFKRFAIDITLVFIYMILLITSRLLVWWVALHAVIFTLYAMWDYWTVHDWTERYYKRPPAGNQYSAGRVYLGGITGSDDVSHGPIITLSWALYFWVLVALTTQSVRPFFGLNPENLRTRIVGTTFFVMVGLILYRRDKAGSFGMMRRIAAVGGLSLLYWTYNKSGVLTDSTILAWAALCSE